MLGVEIENTLLTARPFKYLDVHELNVIRNYCKIINFSQNAVIYEQGKKSQGMNIIIHGEAKVVAKVLGHKLLFLGTLESGNFFGEVSLIKKFSCPATVIAESNVTTLQLSTSYFEMLAVFFPVIHYKISKALLEEVGARIHQSIKSILNLIQNTNIPLEPFKEKILHQFNTAEKTTFETSRINLSHLYHTDFFNKYTESEFDTLLANSELIKVPIDCNLIKVGETNSPIFILIRGAIQSSLIHDGKKVKISVLSPVTVFSNMFFMNDDNAIINYSSCERAILLRIHPEQFHYLHKTIPDFSYKFYHTVSQAFVTLEIAISKLFLRLNSESYNR